MHETFDYSISALSQRGSKDMGELLRSSLCVLSFRHCPPQSSKDPRQRRVDRSFGDLIRRLVLERDEPSEKSLRSPSGEEVNALA